MATQSMKCFAALAMLAAVAAPVQEAQAGKVAFLMGVAMGSDSSSDHHKAPARDIVVSNDEPRACFFRLESTNQIALVNLSRITALEDNRLLFVDGASLVLNQDHPSDLVAMEKTKQTMMAASEACKLVADAASSTSYQANGRYTTLSVTWNGIDALTVSTVPQETGLFEEAENLLAQAFGRPVPPKPAQAVFSVLYRDGDSDAMASGWDQQDVRVASVPETLTDGGRPTYSLIDAKKALDVQWARMAQDKLTWASQPSIPSAVASVPVDESSINLASVAGTRKPRRF